MLREKNSGQWVNAICGQPQNMSNGVRGWSSHSPGVWTAWDHPLRLQQTAFHPLSRGRRGGRCCRDLGPLATHQTILQSVSSPHLFVLNLLISTKGKKPQWPWWVFRLEGVAGRTVSHLSSHLVHGQHAALHRSDAQFTGAVELSHFICYHLEHVAWGPCVCYKNHRSLSLEESKGQRLHFSAKEVEAPERDPPEGTRKGAGGPC